MDIKIEYLEYEDIDECYKMNELIFEESWGLEQVKELYKKLYNRKDMYRFLVAKINNKIVGYVSCIIAYNLFDGNRPFMTLWWVGTHPDYRRKGIATKLFEKVENIAIENNCELIYFTSENYRTEAHEFYKKMGYKMNSKGFVKELD